MPCKKLKIPSAIVTYFQYFVECILQCFAHVRQLDFAEEPDYEILKFFVLDEMKRARLSMKDAYDWVEEVK